MIEYRSKCQGFMARLDLADRYDIRCDRIRSGAIVEHIEQLYDTAAAIQRHLHNSVNEYKSQQVRFASQVH